MDSIDKLKRTLGIGARANKYQVIINTIGGTDDNSSSEELNILAKSASIPSRSISEVEIWNQGRLTTIAGDSDFSGTWSVTFLDNESHGIRKKFIAWMVYIDNVIKHSRETINHKDYMSVAVLNQLSTIDNSITTSYVFEDLWPKSISESIVSDDSQDLVEFTVEFNYSSWENF